MSSKILAVALVAVVITAIAVGGYFYPTQIQQAVDTLGRIGTRFPSGITVGSSEGPISRSATNISNIVTGTCNLGGAPASFSASTSAVFTCSATGVRASDLVFMSPPKGMATGTTDTLGFNFRAAEVVTSDIIQVTMQYLSGPATTSYIQATTSWGYWVVDTQ
jgi:hypothetical protein